MPSANEKVSKFYGVEIWDATNLNNHWYTDVDVNHTIKPEFDAIVQKTINSKYHYVIYPSNVDCLSGTATGNFADNSECEINWDNTQWKLSFMRWLKNKRTKWLKLSDELILQVAITEINFETDTVVNDNFSSKITFSWVEVYPNHTEDDGYVYCNKCNAPLVPNANYCHFCGTAIPASTGTV